MLPLHSPLKPDACNNLQQCARNTMAEAARTLQSMACVTRGLVQLTSKLNYWFRAFSDESRLYTDVFVAVGFLQHPLLHNAVVVGWIKEVVGWIRQLCHKLERADKYRRGCGVKGVNRAVTYGILQ